MGKTQSYINLNLTSFNQNFVVEPRRFHIDGPKPKPSNAACSVSKTTGPPCPSCKCPAFYVEVERTRHLPPRINRIICANCRKRTHEQHGHDLFLVKPGFRCHWSPELERVEPGLAKAARSIENAFAGLKGMTVKPAVALKKPPAEYLSGIGF